MKRDWSSRTAILLIGLILVVINVIGLNVFSRIDLTDDKVYSLSDASIELVENLDDPVTLTAFFTEGLPAQLNTNRRFLKDKLDDYRAYGGSNIQYTFVDPSDDESLREDANRYNIPEQTIRVLENDAVQFKNVYMGLAIQYGTEREIIPVIQDVSTLEYDITGAIRRMTRETLPSVGFLTGHGEPQPQQAYGTLFGELSPNYDVKTITVNDSIPILSETPDALVIVAPTDSFPDHHLQALDAYLMGGGRLAVLLNRVNANLQMGQAMAQSTRLETLLAAYGATVSEDLVMDAQSSVISVQRQQGFFTINQQIEYPFFPIATNFNPNSLMVNRLNNMMFYFVSSIDTTGSIPASVTYEPLVSSSSKSQLQQGFFMIQPGMPPNMQELTGGPYAIAASLSGSFPSAFNGASTSEDTRIIVVGDGDFLNESIVGPIQGNIEFGLNMVDWLVQDDALLAIRAKKIEPRSLNEVSDGARPWIKYINMLMPALLVVLFGLYRWQKRKSRQIILTGN